MGGYMWVFNMLNTPSGVAWVPLDLMGSELRYLVFQDKGDKYEVLCVSRAIVRKENPTTETSYLGWNLSRVSKP